ncbi:MAG: ABC transporter substrate-binding protein [Chloroflexota bacterium]
MNWRRLRASLASGLALAAVAAACTPSSPPGPAPSPTQPAAAPAAAPTTAPALAPTVVAAKPAQPPADAKPSQPLSPAKPTTLVFISLSEPSRLNPIVAPDVQTKAILTAIFDGLVRVNDKMELQPELAASFDVAPDGKQYTFKLRPGAKWHDGKDVTSADVKFTFDTIRNADVKGTIAKTDYAAVEEIAAPDAATVVFKLKTPDASFLSKLAVGVAPRHLLEGQDLVNAEFNRKPVGSGPYRVEEWTAGQQIVLVANPTYFGTKPSIERIVYKLVKDSNVLVVQLTNGEADAGALPAGDVARLRREQKLSFAESVDANTYIGFQLENPLFQDPRVRQALSYAIDRKAIVDKLLEGNGLVSTSDVMPNSWAYNGGVNAYPLDAARAGALLDEAGWNRGADGVRQKGGQPLKFALLSNSGDKTREEVILLVRQAWKQIGVEMEPQFLELNTFINERVLKSNFEAIFLSTSVAVDPDMSRRYHSRSLTNGNNFLRYKNADVDALLDKGLLQTEQAERKATYFKIQEILANESAILPLYYPKVVYGTRAGLEGFKPAPQNPFWNVEEWRLR